MIVRLCDIDTMLSHLCATRYPIALDTETTGLKIHKEDRLFSIILYNGAREPYYLNFNTYPDVGEEWVLPRSIIEKLAPLFSDPKKTWFMHNAKFDMGMLWKEGVELTGKIHCTEAIARLEYNQHLQYSLGQCALRIVKRKSTAVDDYIQEHKLYRYEHDEFGNEERIPCFDKVPFDVMAEYGQQDAYITWALGMHQIHTLKEMDKERLAAQVSIMPLYENECQLTRTCFEMEKIGIPINLGYCREAREHELTIIAAKKKEFNDLTGHVFLDSRRVLRPVFEENKLAYGVTEKGNPSFTDKVLETVNHPIGQCIRDIRSASKKVSTYYENFLYYASNDKLHAQINQGGTATGRLSYEKPNLQNLNKEEDTSERFLVRRAFIPPPDCCFLMIDYDQMEYRLMLDYARQMNVIKKIIDDGLDVHEATAQTMGVDRGRAKTINFMLLYGGGYPKLAAMLEISLKEAKALRENYFDALPNVANFIRGVQNTARERKKIFNWFGRVLQCPDPNFAYALVDHLIQGGCADVVKIAMNRIADLLSSTRTKMIAQVHDELLFALHKDEFELAPKIKQIMETIYPYKVLPLTCSASYSWVSWADKKKGFPEPCQNVKA